MRPLRAFAEPVLATTADFWSVKSASHFSDIVINFKSQQGRAPTFFAGRPGGHRRCRAGGRGGQADRCKTAMKKPSVPWLKGVI